MHPFDQPWLVVRIDVEDEHKIVSFERASGEGLRCPPPRPPPPPQLVCTSSKQKFRPGSTNEHLRKNPGRNRTSANAAGSGTTTAAGGSATSRARCQLRRKLSMSRRFWTRPLRPANPFLAQTGAT